MMKTELNIFCKPHPIRITRSLRGRALQPTAVEQVIRIGSKSQMGTRLNIINEPGLISVLHGTAIGLGIRGAYRLAANQLCQGLINVVN